MTPEAIVILLRELGEVFSLGDQLVSYAQQKHPELRLELIRDEGAAVDQAREAALKRKG